VKPRFAYPVLLGALAALLALLLFLSMLIGPSWQGTLNLLSAMRGGEGDLAWLIMAEIRLPRTLLAALIGFTLGVCGAALQGLLRNPLADPGIIGVSPAASLGAVLMLYTGLSSLFPLALPLAAIASGLLAMLALQGLAGRGGMLTLILAGAGVSSLAGALTALVLNLSPNPYAAQEIVFWIMGSVTDRSMDHVALSAPFMLAGWALLGLAAPSLNALSLGEDTAASLGVDLRRTRWLVVGGAALAVGAATAVSGVIGFVGLVVPHLMRPLVGHSPGRLLPASGLAGAVLLLAADILVRVVTPGAELRLGVVTALLGAPFFLWLVLRARMELES
jgi:iron complex transport system permease protein